MIKLLKTYKKILLAILLPYLAVVFVLVYPTNYSVTAPGGITPVDQFIELEGVELYDNFYTVHVLSYYPITVFQSWILKNDIRMDVDEITPLERDTSNYDNYLKGQLSKHVSLKNAVISAYELAAEVNSEVTIDYYFDGLYIYTRPSRLSDLKIGDHVVKINGISFEGHTPRSFAQLIGDSDFSLTIRRTISGVPFEIDIDYVKQDDDVNFFFYEKYEIIEAYPQFNIEGFNNLIGGPSGGLLQTLNLYASLANINIGDDKISGTGTISVAGNVGRIGGLVQKIYTAKDHHVDVFFLPRSQFSEIESMRFDFDVVPVSTLREAVEWLNDKYN
jgi:Lon-like protease